MSGEEVRGVTALLKAAQMHCVCPICMYLFHDPAGLPCGHVFCRRCLSRCLQDRHQCPLCNRESSSRRSIIPLPNLALFTSLVRQLMDRILSDLDTEREGKGEGKVSPPPPQQAWERPTRSLLTVPLEAVHAPLTAATAAVSSDHTLSGPSAGAESVGSLPSSAPVNRLLMSEPLLTELSSSKFFNPQLRVSPTPPPVVSMECEAETQALAVAAPTPLQLLQPRQRRQSPAPVEGSCTPVLSQVPLTELLSDGVPLPADLSSAKQHFLATSVRTLRVQGPGTFLFTPPAFALQEGEQAAATFDGCCVLCGLDTTDRDSVRAFLASLLNSPSARCEARELAELTEEALEAMLGPLWRVTIAAGGLPQDGGDRPCLSVTAHHNCLAWVGLLPEESGHRCTKSAFTASLVGGSGLLDTADLASVRPFSVVAPEEIDPSLARLANALLDSVEAEAGMLDGMAAKRPRQQHPPSQNALPSTTAACTVCRRSESFLVHAVVSSSSSLENTCDPRGVMAATAVPPTIGLRRCHAAAPAPVCSHQRRAFHLPCALLAAADVCLVLGLDAEDSPLENLEVWCGPCYRKKRKRSA